MDNLTHTLTGLLLSRAGLDRFYPRAGAVLMLAANAPDLDAVSFFAGPVAYLHFHRFVTHSIFAAPILALVPALIVCAFRRTSAGWLAAWALSVVGIASHLLLDWTNSYGIRLLLPFSPQWFHLDLVNVIDYWIWGALAFAAVWPFLSRLVNAEIGAKGRPGRGIAIAALLFVVLYDGARVLIHSRALDVLNARMYDQQNPLRTGAFPGALNPFRWRGVVETSTAYRVFDLDLNSEFDPSSGRTLFKAEQSPALEAARQTPAFQVFQDFAQYPLWTTTPLATVAGGTQVLLSDMRFGFGAVADVDAQARVLQSRLHF